MKKTIVWGLLLVCSNPFFAQEKRKLVNLGKNVNSAYAEIQPYIAPDGSKLFFTRDNHPENTLSPQETQDIWYCKLGPDSQWMPAKHLGKPFNRTTKNALFYQSVDGNERIIRGIFKNGEFTRSGYSVCRMTPEGWGDPEAINIKRYEKMSQGKYAGICLSPDNKNMILYMSEDERKDICDLYVSRRESNSNWSQPEKLPFSTPQYTESTPFVAADGVTLYFSSDRPGGFGSSDIWMTRRLDDTWLKWSEPVNLGPTINTPQWDAYYTVPATGKTAYMVSTDPNGFGGADLIRIDLVPENRPKPVVLVTGKVLDAKTGKPVQAAISYFKLPEGTEAGIASSTPGTGEYQIVLPQGHQYGFKADAPGYYAISENIDLRELKDYRELKRDLYLVPIEINKPIRLNNIFFDFGKATLQAESFPELDKVVALLQENPTMKIEIHGHTDDVGDNASNQKLSDDRAAAVKTYLAGKGITDDRVVSRGFGEDKPVESNSTPEGREKNRRVEFVITSK